MNPLCGVTYIKDPAFGCGHQLFRFRIFNPVRGLPAMPRIPLRFRHRVRWYRRDQVVFRWDRPAIPGTRRVNCPRLPHIAAVSTPPLSRKRSWLALLGAATCNISG